MASPNVVELTGANWQEQVINNPNPVIVDFWAVWCGPCRNIAPYMDQLATEYAGRATVGKVNIDNAQDLAIQFRINSIPQVYIFKNGQVVERLAGAQPKQSYSAALDRVLAS